MKVYLSLSSDSDPLPLGTVIHKVETLSKTKSYRELFADKTMSPVSPKGFIGAYESGEAVPIVKVNMMGTSDVKVKMEAFASDLSSFLGGNYTVKPKGLEILVKFRPN
jgi:hypothetical protein